MKLVVLMYHRASAGRHGNDPDTLDAHFAHIARHYRCVLPGDALDADRLNVCLSFDDGYADFRTVVYPLLAKHDLRALLAVPVSFLQDRASPATPDASGDADDDGTHPGTFCTWSELAEMSASGRVVVASHGLTHVRLDRGGPDLHAEIVVPQTLLAARLGRPVESFVLPFGRFDRDVLAIAKAHYRYVFRIGSADNPGWDAPVLYRVDADEMLSADALFGWRHLAGYRIRRHWNAWRRR